MLVFLLLLTLLWETYTLRNLLIILKVIVYVVTVILKTSQLSIYLKIHDTVFPVPLDYAGKHFFFLFCCQLFDSVIW